MIGSVVARSGAWHVAFFELSLFGRVSKTDEEDSEGATYKYCEIEVYPFIHGRRCYNYKHSKQSAIF